MTDATLRSIRISPATMQRLRARATVRGLSQGEYVARLIDLHDACRGAPGAESRTSYLGAILETLGLQTIREGE